MIPGLTIAGLFLAGFLSVGVALAETYTLASGDTIEPAPDSTLAVTGFYGITTGAPPVGGSVQGIQVFDVYNSSGDRIGSFEAFVSDNSSNVSNGTDEEMLVSHVLSGTAGSGPEDVPQVGSVLDFYNGTGLASNYSDLASTTGDQNVVADTVNTIFGSFNFPSALDASEHVDAHVEQPIPLADGYRIVADPDSPETFSSVSAIPPVYVAGQGNQLFDLLNPDGEVIGKFTAEATTTGDGLDGHSLALVVTGDKSGDTVGTSPGELPAPGSVFTILYYFNPNISTVYSDLASTTGGPNVIANTLHLFGSQLNLPTSFDAVKGLTDAFTGGTPQIESISFGDGLKIVPVGAETYSGINALPTVGSVDVQGYQTFDVVNKNGDVLATFNADVTNYAGSGKEDEALIVTQDGNTGTTPTDAPPVGSWMEYTKDGNGFATNYSDLIGNPHNTITETWITPFGDFDIPTATDAAAGLGGVDFFVPPDLSFDPPL